MNLFNLCKCCCKKEKKYFMLEKADYEKLECDDECGICLDPLKYSPCIKTEKCNHVFHKYCYRKYVNTTRVRKNLGCPFCDTNQDNLNIYIFEM